MKAIFDRARTLILCLFLTGCAPVTPVGTGTDGTKAVLPTEQGSWTAGDKIGIISDSLCGPSHTGMLRTGSMGADDASCTLKCVEAGSQFVLVESETGKIYRLLDQATPRKLAGRRVRITGEINEAVRIIRSERLVPVGSPPGSAAPLQ